MDLDATNVKLTDLASCGGCAAKYSAARLEQLLAGFVPVEAENLLVGLGTPDDAAVYRLDDERAIIFTLDFFPPIVDDPGDYGSIAATNALNDVFAMGGTPLLALSIAAFPEELPMEMLGQIFGGADEIGAQVRRHARRAATRFGTPSPSTVLRWSAWSIPQGVWTKSTAQPGDALYVTKPLGTGLIMTGYKRGQAGSQQLERAVGWMKTLNKDAADVLRPMKVNAVTDVTGFGLFGHAHEMAERSGVRIRLESERFPAIDGALEIARKRHSDQRRSAKPRLRRPSSHAEGRAGHTRGAGVRPPDRRRTARIGARRAGPGARGRVRQSPSLRAPHRSGRRGLRRLRRVGHAREARDDSRAVPALPSWASRVHARSVGALRRALGRDHEPRSRPCEAGGERPGAAPARVEPVHVRRASADGEGCRRRPRARRRSACT